MAAGPHGHFYRDDTCKARSRRAQEFNAWHFTMVVHGTIFNVDLEIYAAHQAAQLGATVKQHLEMNKGKVFELDSSHLLQV